MEIQTERIVAYTDIMNYVYQLALKIEEPQVSGFFMSNFTISEHVLQPDSKQTFKHYKVSKLLTMWIVKPGINEPHLCFTKDGNKHKTSTHT